MGSAGVSSICLTPILQPIQALCTQCLFLALELQFKYMGWCGAHIESLITVFNIIDLSRHSWFQDNSDGKPHYEQKPWVSCKSLFRTHHTIVTHLSLLFSTILDASELMKWLNTITSSDWALAALGTSSSWIEFNCWGTSLPLILVLITTSLFVILEFSTIEVQP